MPIPVNEVEPRFLANPRDWWASRDCELRRAVLRLRLSKPLVYDRETGFRTACKSMPFRALDDFIVQKGEMVDATGLEPVTLAL